MQDGIDSLAQLSVASVAENESVITYSGKIVFEVLGLFEINAVGLNRPT